MPETATSYHHQDIVSGSIARGIVKLSLPIILALLFQTGFSIIDMVFLGRLSARALAALGMIFPVLFFFISFALGLGVGISSFVARAVGAGDIVKAGSIAANGLVAGTLVSTGLAVVGLAVSRPLFLAMGAGPELIDLILAYTRVAFGSCPLILFLVFCNSIMRGEGDAQTPMKLLMLATLINLVLDPVLIFGLGPIPAMGIRGAAVAMVLSRLLAGIMAARHLLSGRSRVRPPVKGFRFDGRIVMEIFRVGVPSSLSNMSSSIALMLFTRMVASYGPLAVAAYGIGGRIESIAVMPAFGMAGAVLTMAGQNFGGAQMSRAARSVVQGTWMLCGFMVVIGIASVIFARPLTAIFTTDQTVIAYGVTYLYFRAPFFAFIGIRMTVSSGFSGVGDAKVALSTLLFGLFIVGLPLAWLSETTMGIQGIWVGLSCAHMAGALLSILLFVKAFPGRKFK